MTVDILLSELRTAGITLAVEGNELRFCAPVGAMTAELKSTLAARKRELVEALRSAEPSPIPLCSTAAGGREPFPVENTPKRPGCPSRTSRRHVWGEFFC